MSQFVAHHRAGNSMSRSSPHCKLAAIAQENETSKDTFFTELRRIESDSLRDDLRSPTFSAGG